MQLKTVLVFLPAITGLATAHDESSHAGESSSWAAESSSWYPESWSSEASVTGTPYHSGQLNVSTTEYDTAKPTGYGNHTTTGGWGNSTTTKKYTTTHAIVTSSEEAITTAKPSATRTAATTSATGTSGATNDKRASEFGAVVLGLAIAAGLAL